MTEYVATRIHARSSESQTHIAAHLRKKYLVRRHIAHVAWQSSISARLGGSYVLRRSRSVRRALVR